VAGTANASGFSIPNGAYYIYNGNTNNGGTLGPKITILPNGNVGIGTASPGYPLDVTGIIRSNVGLLGPYGAGGWGAGMYTDAGNMILYFDNSGNTHRWDTKAVVKTFIIDHPVDKDKYLVHGTLEGPEGAVFYRGTASLKNGKTQITLPNYFEALTRSEGYTIQLTNVDGFDKLAVHKVNGSKINHGQFIVISDKANSSQEFDWEVKAVRKDVAPLIVEPNKSDIDVYGDGPYKYTYGEKKK